MTDDLRKHITAMAQRAKPTPERMKEVIDEWDTYFTMYGIPPNKEREEFSATFRRRLEVGVISIVAPTMDECKYWRL